MVHRNSLAGWLWYTIIQVYNLQRQGVGGGKRHASSCFIPCDGLAPLTLVELQSHFGGNSLKFQVVCPQIGTAVLKGLTMLVAWKEKERDFCCLSLFFIVFGATLDSQQSARLDSKGKPRRGSV